MEAAASVKAVDTEVPTPPKAVKAMDTEFATAIEVPANKPQVRFWVPLLTAGALLNLVIIYVVAFSGDKSIRFWRVAELLAYLFSLNFLSSAIFFVLLRRFVLRRWCSLTDQDVADIDGDRAHLPGSWLTDLLARPGLRWKLKITDALSRKGGHIWRNVINYVLISGVLAKEDTTELMVAGMTGTFVLAACEGALVLWFPSAEYPKLWSWGTLCFRASNRIRDGHWACVNLLTAGVAGNLGIVCAYGIAMLVLPAEVEGTKDLEGTKELWRFAINMVTLPLIFGDALGEIIGTPFGRHQFNVRGFGEINKKSLEGCAAVFAGTLVPTLIVTLVADTGPNGEDASTATIVALPLLLSVVVTFVETFSFRSTDNFTIPVAAALALMAWYELIGF